MNFGGPKVKPADTEESLSGLVVPKAGGPIMKVISVKNSIVKCSWRCSERKSEMKKSYHYTDLYALKPYRIPDEIRIDSP